jgi:hypothetical protein
VVTIENLLSDQLRITIENIGGADEASNMALDQIAGSHSLAAAANRRR